MNLERFVWSELNYWGEKYRKIPGISNDIPGIFRFLVNLKKKISEINAKKLMDGKKTGLIKGMKGKSGREFDAYLELNDSGRIEFENETYFRKIKIDCTDD